MTAAAVVATKGFDAVLVAHALLAIAALVVLLVLRAAARAVARGGDLPASARRSFTGRRELAGRTVHLVPLSGLCLVGLSRGAYGLSTPFVAVGLGAWVVAAYAVEGIAFPAQRTVAGALDAGTDASRPARRMALATELAALAVVVAGVVMVAAQSG